MYCPVHDFEEMFDAAASSPYIDDPHRCTVCGSIVSEAEAVAYNEGLADGRNVLIDQMLQWMDGVCQDLRMSPAYQHRVLGRQMEEKFAVLRDRIFGQDLRSCFEMPNTFPRYVKVHCWVGGLPHRLIMGVDLPAADDARPARIEMLHAYANTRRVDLQHVVAKSGYQMLDRLRDAAALAARSGLDEIQLSEDGKIQERQ